MFSGSPTVSANILWRRGVPHHIPTSAAAPSLPGRGLGLPDPVALDRDARIRPADRGAVGALLLAHRVLRAEEGGDLAAILRQRLLLLLEGLMRDLHDLRLHLDAELALAGSQRARDRDVGEILEELDIHPLLRQAICRRADELMIDVVADPHRGVERREPRLVTDTVEQVR